VSEDGFAVPFSVRSATEYTEASMDDVASNHPSPGQPPPVSSFSAADVARRVLRLAATGGLGTLGANGAPFVSLVTTSTTSAGEPLLLLSDIAVHARNLKRDRRVALLLAASGGQDGDPLAGIRLTVSGTILEEVDARCLRRFLAHHAEAEGYATFRDFHLYRLEIVGGYLVAGFGQVVDLAPRELLVDCSDCAELIEAEVSAIEHMNADHAEALALYATRLLGMPHGAWTATGADPEGLDLRAGGLRARLPFPEKVRNGGDLRAILVRLAKDARVRIGGRSTPGP